ncbi:MAG TPA: SgcJ/EcaC family oxidoreductase [Gemmatimonadaceae bacterium]|jgi:uncharacterized protein (TIGR02246 family)
MMRTTRAALALLVAAATGCVFVAGNTGSLSVSPSTTQLAEARAEISSMMDESARAWTKGDLDGFMDSYEAGSGITYVTPAGVVHGRDAIRARYAPRFAQGARQDSLSFENLEIDLLAPDLANVIAYYRLSRGDSTTARGPTSLVMRKREGQWRIIHDHSS